MEQQTPQLQGLRCRRCRLAFSRTVIMPCAIEHYVQDSLAMTCPRCGAGSSEILLGLGLTMEEDRLRRQPGARLPLRAANWILQGETGLSSEAIHSHMTEDSSSDERPAPRDLDDLRRCILLMQHVPEWMDRIEEMRVHSEWSILAGRFKEACDAYLSESPNLDGPSPRAARILEDCLGDRP